MQAPILSFDEEGDIPIPTIKGKRKYWEDFYLFDRLLCLDFFPSGDAELLSSRETIKILKAGDDKISIERTRRDKFREAFRSVSKVAFSQLGLGK